MKMVFFVSSVGDTDLAKATISKLIEQGSTDSIFLIPLTSTAIDRTKDLKEKSTISIFSLEDILKQAGVLARDRISVQEANAIKLFVESNGIQHAYIGVPSNNNEVPYQIASCLTIPCTIAYEYMFKPEKHGFWSYVDELASKGNCDFAVPLNSAKNDILAINSKAIIHEVGHLSLDGIQSNAVDKNRILEKLSVDADQELIFVSGTTQPTEVDNQFLEALLSELSTGKYPTLQLRFGIHPGVKDTDLYIQALLKTCEMYPGTKDQFKIVVTGQMAGKLKQPISETPFVLRVDVSGPDAAQVADKISQAVPGALLNEAALKGKPSYFHEKTAKPYLPNIWFSENISSFFKAKAQLPHGKEELRLTDVAPSVLSKILGK